MAIKVFDDTNYQQLILEGNTYGTGRVVPVGYSLDFAKPFSSRFQRIPRSEWSDRIKEQKAKRRRISDCQKFKSHSQRGPTCWSNGPVHAATTKRVQQGYQLAYLSGQAIAVEISGGTSGGYEWEAVKLMMEKGAPSVEAYPNDTLSRALLRDQKVIDSRKHFVVLEALKLQGFDDFATAALLAEPFACAFDWWRHVISGGDLVEVERNSFALDLRNNWGDGYGHKNDYGFGGYVLLREGRGTPDSGCVIYEMTPYAAAG